jgi:hypothetical protein
MPDRKAKLFFEERSGDKVLSTEVQWKSFAYHREMTRVYDSALALAQLPRNEELPQILVAAAEYGLPSISRRANPSILEMEAASLFTAIACSSKRSWPNLLREYLTERGWKFDLHGRPGVPKQQTTDFTRGKEIDILRKKLEPSFNIKQEAKRRKRYSADDEAIEKKLRSRGCNADEIKSILKGRSLRAAACLLWCQTQMIKPGLRAVQNSYARYSRLKNQTPSK